LQYFSSELLSRFKCERPSLPTKITARIQEVHLLITNYLAVNNKVLFGYLVLQANNHVEKSAPPVGGANSETSLSLFTALLASSNNRLKLQQSY